MVAWDEPLREVKPPSSLLLTKLSRRKANLPGRYYFIFHFIFIFIIAQPSSLQPHSGAARTPILPGKTKPRGLCPPSLTPKLLCQGSSLAGRLGPAAMHVSGPSSSERSLAGGRADLLLFLQLGILSSSAMDMVQPRSNLRAGLLEVFRGWCDSSVTPAWLGRQREPCPA